MQLPPASLYGEVFSFRGFGLAPSCLESRNFGHRARRSMLAGALSETKNIGVSENRGF